MQEIDSKIEMGNDPKENIFDNPMIKYISQFTKLTEEEAIDFIHTYR